MLRSNYVEELGNTIDELRGLDSREPDKVDRKDIEIDCLIQVNEQLRMDIAQLKKGVERIDRIDL